MQISSKFTIAIHTLLCIEHFGKERKVTSNFIADSTNVNPVIIRRILGELKDAGIVTVESGVGGASIVKPLDKITMLDVFKAVNCLESSLFNFHNNPNIECPVGNKIHNVLDTRLENIENVMLNELSKVNLKMLSNDLEEMI